MTRGAFPAGPMTSFVAATAAEAVGLVAAAALLFDAAGVQEAFSATSVAMALTAAALLAAAITQLRWIRAASETSQQPTPLSGIDIAQSPSPSPLTSQPHHGASSRSIAAPTPKSASDSLQSLPAIAGSRRGTLAPSGNAETPRHRVVVVASPTQRSAAETPVGSHLQALQPFPAATLSATTLPRLGASAHDECFSESVLRPSSAAAPAHPPTPALPNPSAVNIAGGAVAFAYAVLAAVAAVDTGTPLFTVYALAAFAHIVPAVATTTSLRNPTRVLAALGGCSAILWIAGVAATSARLDGSTRLAQASCAADPTSLRRVWAAAAVANGAVVAALLIRLAAVVTSANAQETAAAERDQLIARFIEGAGAIGTLDHAAALLDSRAADTVLAADPELRANCRRLLRAMGEAAAFVPGNDTPLTAHTPDGVSRQRRQRRHPSRNDVSGATPCPHDLSVSNILEFQRQQPPGPPSPVASCQSAATPFATDDQAAGANRRQRGNSVMSPAPSARGSPHQRGLAVPSHARTRSLSLRSGDNVPTTEAIQQTYAVIAMRVCLGDAANGDKFAAAYEAVECAALLGGTLLQGWGDEIVVVFPAHDGVTHTAMRAASAALNVFLEASLDNDNNADEEPLLTAAVAIGPGTRTVLGSALRSVRLTGPVVDAARALLRFGAEDLRPGAVYVDASVANEIANSHIVLPVDIARLAPRRSDAAMSCASVVYRVVGALDLPAGLGGEEWMYQLQAVTDATPPAVPELRRAFADYARGDFAAALRQWQALLAGEDAGRHVAAADLPRLIERCQALQRAEGQRDTSTETARRVPLLVGVCEPPIMVPVPRHVIGM